MWNEKFQMGYKTLTGYIALLLLLMIVFCLQKCHGKRVQVIETETYKLEYVLPKDVDTVNINNASVLELKHIGFTNYEIVSMLSSRERGFVFRNIEQLKQNRYFDTLKINVMAPYLLFDTTAMPYKPRFANKKKTKSQAYNRKVSLYYTTEEEFVNYGVPKAVIDTISHYKECYYMKGSVVLSELLSATPSTIGELLTSHISGEKRQQAKQQKVIQKVELNSATVEELVKLPWIKDKTANTILKYRDRLKGFVDISQLLEVYGIDSVRYEKICQNIYVDETKIEKIYINRKLKEGFYHPYVTKELKHALSMNRRTNKVSNVDEFVELYQGKYTNKWLEKYLSFEK